MSILKKLQKYKFTDKTVNNMIQALKTERDKEIRDFIRNTPVPRVSFLWVLDLTRDNDFFFLVAVLENRLNSRQITPVQEISEKQLNRGQFITDRASAALQRLARRRPRSQSDSDEDTGRENKSPRNNPDND